MSPTNPEFLSCPRCGYMGRPVVQTFGAEVYYVCPECGGHMIDQESLKQLKQIDELETKDKRHAVSGDEFPHFDRPLVARILLAEDSEMLRTMIRDGIMEANLAVEVLATCHGEEAVNTFARLHQQGKLPDCVILDASMPLLPGTATAVAIRAMEEGGGLPSRTPFVFFTLLDFGEIKPVMEIVGRSTYLPKHNGESRNSMFRRLSKAIQKVLAEA